MDVNRKPRAKPKAARSPKRVLPRFGRPGTAGKAEGPAAVNAWIAGVKPEHRAIVKNLDALIGDVAPNVRRAIKWSTPMYGLHGQGWFANVASFNHYVSPGFFAGARLDPAPPSGEGKGMRRINIQAMSEYDERRFRSWIQQAARLKGWGAV